MSRNRTEHHAPEENVISLPEKGRPPRVPDFYDDPLEELLNEFSEYDEDDEPTQEFSLEETIPGFNPADLDRAKDDDVAEEEMDELIAEQLSVLEESTRRMRFYLDEIELFLPEQSKDS